MDKRSHLSLLAGLGFSTGLFGLMFVLAFIAKLVLQGRLRPLYLLAFTVTTCIGWLLTCYALRAANRLETAHPRTSPLKPRPSLEGQILLLAQAARGRLSASEVAAATYLSVDESHDALRGLIREGVAEMWVTDEGGFVYVFPEFFADFKESAKNSLTL